MARLTDMLQPDETVVHRVAMPPEAALVVLLWAIFAGGMAADVMYRYPPARISDALFMLGAFAVPAFIIPVAVTLMLLWAAFPAWAITDRRVIALGGPLRNRRQEIALDEVEDARFADGQLTLEGGGRKVTIRAQRIPADILAQPLGRWFPDIGKPKIRLRRILEPGETVLLRNPVFWDAVVLLGLIAFGGFLLWDGLWSLAAGGEADVGSLVFGLFFVLAVYWAVVERRVHVMWTTVVTDRRLLRTLPHDPARYEEFPLAAIEAVPPAAFGDRLFVRLRGEEVQLPAKGEAAERIRGAIAAAKGAA